MATVEERMTATFLAWLGNEIFSDQNADRYVAVYRKFSGRPEGELGPVSDADWDHFAATLDSWAASQMPAVLGHTNRVRPVLLPRAESRQPMHGLRRGLCTPRISINAASEEVLRQIPGIGVSSARRIVNERAQRGPFSAVHDVVGRGCLSAEALRLSEPYLCASVDPASAREVAERCVDFATYVRVRHALQPKRSADLAGTGIAELERAVDSGGATSYWKPRRSGRGRAFLPIDDARTQLKRLLTSEQELQAAPLDSEIYVKVLKRLFAKAKTSIRVQTPSLGILHVATLRPILSALAEAVARNVDVRVLFDADYAPSAMGSDDVAYLRARNVPCRAYPVAARMHSRVVVVDGEHVICGSHSWSPTSMYHSEELALYIQSQQLAAQHEVRFQMLWQAAEPDRRFAMSLFRFWARATHDKLLNAGVTDPKQILSIAAVEGLEPAELDALRREVRLVTQDSLPVPIAHRLAHAGVDDLAVIANQKESEMVMFISERTTLLDRSDLAPVGPFLGAYFRRRAAK
jgi:PLD-like domain/Helix-hairpin-helix motif